MKPIWIVCCAGLISSGVSLAAEQVVRKVAEDFGSSLWNPSQYGRALVKPSLSTENAPGAKISGSQTWDVSFGSDFESCTMEPRSPLWIPGSARSVSVRIKTSDERFTTKLMFSDGWGREKVDGKPLEIELKEKPARDHLR